MLTIKYCEHNYVFAVINVPFCSCCECLGGFQREWLTAWGTALQPNTWQPDQEWPRLFWVMSGSFGVCKQWGQQAVEPLVECCANFIQIWLLKCMFSAHRLFCSRLDFCTKFWSWGSKLSFQRVGGCWQALENAQWSGKCWCLWKIIYLVWKY